MFLHTKYKEAHNILECIHLENHIFLPMQQLPAQELAG